MSDTEQNQGLGLDDVLNAAMGLSGAAQHPQQQPGNALGDVLGSLLGAAGAQQPQPQAQANPLEDALGSLLGGAGGQTHPQQQPANPLGDVLGGLLGGAFGQHPQQQQPANPIGDVLGSILGGGQGQATPPVGGGTGVLGDILSGLLGGGNAPSAMAQTGITGSIISGIAQKTGLPPMVISVALTFVIGKLMRDARNPQRQQVPQAPAQAQGSLGTLFPQTQPPSAQPQADAMGLDDILHRMQGGHPIDKHYIHQNGLAEELGGQLGMSNEQAGDLLHEVFAVLQHLPQR